MATADSSPALVVQRVEPAETPNTSEIRAALPERERYQLQLLLTDAAMSLVPRIHDGAYVHETTYDAETVTIDFEARSETVAKVREQADALQQ